MSSEEQSLLAIAGSVRVGEQNVGHIVGLLKRVSSALERIADVLEAQQKHAPTPPQITPPGPCMATTTPPGGFPAFCNQRAGHDGGHIADIPSGKVSWLDLPVVPAPVVERPPCPAVATETPDYDALVGAVTYWCSLRKGRPGPHEHHDTETGIATKKWS